MCMVDLGGNEAGRHWKNDSKRHPLDSIVVEEKLGSLREYRSQVQQWREVMEVIEHRALRAPPRDSSESRAKSWRYCYQRPATWQASFVSVSGVRRGGRRTDWNRRTSLGSSEVLESIIGKYKCIAGERGQHGLTGIVLAIGALVGRMTVGTVQDALEQVTCQDARSWCQSHLGPTVQGLRQRFVGTEIGTKMQTTIPDGA